MSQNYAVNAEEQSGCSKICSFFYNKSNGTVMGRTGKSWALILLFYAIYYACLAGFFISMLTVFLKFTVPVDSPTLTGHQSLLKMSPGMGFKPQPDVRSTLIRFDPGNAKSYKPYVDDLKETFNKYTNFTAEERKQIFNNGPCKDSSKKFAQDNLQSYKERKVCGFPLATLGANCQSANGFGFPAGKPCVFIHINKVYGWLPEIASTTQNDVHVQCKGENPADVENLGKVVYSPSVDVKENVTDASGNKKEMSVNKGVIYSSYFPFMAQKAYRSPLVSLTFPEIKKQTVVLVQCQLSNVKNMKFDKPLRLGMVRFELLIESNKSA